MPPAKEGPTLGAGGGARVFLLRSMCCLDRSVEIFRGTVGNRPKDLARGRLYDAVSLFALGFR